MFFVSSLLGKALRKLVKSCGLPSSLTCAFKAEPGKLDIKRREPGILFYQLTIWFTLQTSEYDVIIAYRVVSASLATHLKSATSS